MNIQMLDAGLPNAYQKYAEKLKILHGQINAERGMENKEKQALTSLTLGMTSVLIGAGGIVAATATVPILATALAVGVIALGKGIFHLNEPSLSSKARRLTEDYESGAFEEEMNKVSLWDKLKIAVEKRLNSQNARPAFDPFPLPSPAPFLAKDVKLEPQIQAATESNIPELDFDAIRKVVEVSRQLATADFLRHIEAARDAKTPEETQVAIDQLSASHKTTQLMDSAYKSLNSSEAHFRSTAVSLVKGENQNAINLALVSSDHLAEVAKSLDKFSVQAPQSKFFASTLDALNKVDKAAAKLESNVAMKVGEFSTGLKAFATRVADFGLAVSKFPSTVANSAKSTGASMADAVISTGSKFMSGMRDLLHKVENKMTSALESTELTAFEMIQKSGEFATKIQQRVENVADTVAAHGKEVANSVSRHTNAVVGIGSIAAESIGNHVSTMASLSGGLLAKVGQSVAEAGQALATKYGEQLEKVDTERSVRRSMNRP